MAKELKTAVIESLDEGVDLLDLPDSDIIEGEKPDYRIVVTSIFLLTLGTFLFLRHYARRH